MVVGSVKLDVESMLLLKVDHHVLDVLHLTSSGSHGLGGEIGVASRTIPVCEELWSEGHSEAELFRNSVEEISGNGEVVSLFDSSAWSNLELPLSWHDLSICS